MPRLTIDNQVVEVAEGTTILKAAEQLGITIPAMCYLKDFEPSMSCMLCVVQIDGAESLVPSCAAVVKEGMVVTTDSEQIHLARKTALELLLSDHLGDCMGPCQTICPARMNIPLMIRQIAAGQLSEAIKTIKRDIALPAVLGRICPAPCEKGCRRAACDQAVSICLLKRYVADVDLQSSQPYRPACARPTGKKVAIVGAGPAGLAAAYYLLQRGIGCTIYDDHEELGGMLTYGVAQDELLRDILAKEIEHVTELGPELRLGTKVGQDLSFESICSSFDAVFIAAGDLSGRSWKFEPAERTEKGIAIDGRTYKTSVPGVFAGGDAVRKRRLTVRAVADGKEAAIAISQYLLGQDLVGAVRPFNTRIGKIQPSEIDLFLTLASKSSRIEPTKRTAGYSDTEAITEAQRCLHCDCRKIDACKLRQYSQEFSVSASRYDAPRRSFEQHLANEDIIYEPGKCIACGLCIQIAAREKEQLGLTFIGRGFDVRVGVALSKELDDGLRLAARKCAQVCPTGALVLPGT